MLFSSRFVHSQYFLCMCFNSEGSLIACILYQNYSQRSAINNFNKSARSQITRVKKFDPDWKRNGHGWERTLLFLLNFTNSRAITLDCLWQSSRTWPSFYANKQLNEVYPGLKKKCSDTERTLLFLLNITTSRAISPNCLRQTCQHLLKVLNICEQIVNLTPVSLNLAPLHESQGFWNPLSELPEYFWQVSV